MEIPADINNLIAQIGVLSAALMELEAKQAAAFISPAQRMIADKRIDEIKGEIQRLKAQLKAFLEGNKQDQSKQKQQKEKPRQNTKSQRPQKQYHKAKIGKRVFMKLATSRKVIYMPPRAQQKAVAKKSTERSVVTLGQRVFIRDNKPTPNRNAIVVQHAPTQRQATNGRSVAISNTAMAIGRGGSGRGGGGR
jgi:hypothetical protein